MNETTLLQLAREHITLTGGNPDAAPIDGDTDLREAIEMAGRAAREDAASAIEIARESDDPVAFITGNSHMPPLRAFGRAEDFWAASHDVDAYMISPYEVYVETFESTLEAANVIVECPEYDNALYVVDLDRWEYDEDLDGPTLSSQWRAVEPS